MITFVQLAEATCARWVVQIMRVVVDDEAPKAVRKSDRWVAQRRRVLRKKEARLPHGAEAGLCNCCFELWPLGLAAASISGHSTQKQVVAA